MKRAVLKLLPRGEEAVNQMKVGGGRGGEGEWDGGDW